MKRYVGGEGQKLKERPIKYKVIMQWGEAKVMLTFVQIIQTLEVTLASCPHAVALQPWSITFFSQCSQILRLHKLLTICPFLAAIEEETSCAA